MTRHEMTLAQSYPDADCQEWTCPVCGRSMLLYLDPFSVDELIPGDETASHYGSMLGDDTPSGTDLRPNAQAAPVSSGDDRLDAFREFLERLP